MSNQFKPELLSLILKKDFWKKYKHLVLRSMFTGLMDKVFSSIENFHDNYAEDLDKDKLWEILKADHPTLTTSHKSELAEVIAQVKEVNEWTEEFAEKILSGLYKVEVGTNVAKAGLDLAQGRVKDLEGVKDILFKHGDNFIPKNTFVECRADIQELVTADAGQTTWKFNLTSMQERLGGLPPGYFFQLLARPDVGKTAFVVSLVCGPGGWAEQGAKVDWYCNEEKINRTRWRCISAYTGLTKDQLIKNMDFAQATWDKIKENVRTIEVPFGTPVEHIAARTRDRKPDFVIVDQLDKLGVRPIVSSFDSETDRIRLLYIKFRELGRVHNAVTFGVCQASAEAEGRTIVTYSMSEGSKTGKGAEVDVFCGLGRRPLSESMQEEDYTRYVTISKSKLDSGWKGTFACKLSAKISRFEA